jgi:hypothetical protein
MINVALSPISWHGMKHSPQSWHTFCWTEDVDCRCRSHTVRTLGVQFRIPACV